MLTLRLRSGEYIAIGDQIAVQVFRQNGSNFEVAVKAPREVPVCRGEVYEQQNQRPEGLRAPAGHSPQRREKPARREDAARQIDGILEKWKGKSPELEQDIARIRAQVARMRGERTEA